MKFEVDVKEFWIEEGELSSELIRALKREIINQIQSNIKEQVDTFMNTKLTEELKKNMEIKVGVLMEAFLENGKIRDNYGRTESTIQEWLATHFKSNNDSTLRAIKAEADKQALAIKQRYDLLFASQIVQKLNEQGMLKENIASLLLSSDGKDS